MSKPYFTLYSTIIDPCGYRCPPTVSDAGRNTTTPSRSCSQDRSISSSAEAAHLIPTGITVKT